VARFVLAVLGALAGCSRESPPPAPAAPDAAAALPALFVSSALRCGECHEHAEREWRRSAHARAASEPLYQAMRAEPGAEGCDRCHAPLAAALGPGDAVTAEGVTCDVCHTIDRVELGQKGAIFALRLDGNVKFGPLCDARDQYFHRMGCSPLHREAIFCAACHTHREGDLPVYTEYQEWRDGPYALDEMV
jgi:hypothetical protein